jgi:nicotinamidase-related amidase
MTYCGTSFPAFGSSEDSIQVDRFGVWQRLALEFYTIAICHRRIEMNEALLVIDVQKLFYQGTSKRYIDAALPIIKNQIDICRHDGIPVIWIQHLRLFGKLKNGNPEFEVLDELGKKEGERSVVKRYPNSFRKTELQKILESLRISRLRICGYKADSCVLFTFLGARKAGYEAHVITGGTASSSCLGLKIGSMIYKKSMI